MKTHKLIALAMVLATAMLAFSAQVSLAQISQDQVTQQLENTYGVKVLRIQPIENRKKAAYAVTMMNPAGNVNEADQVNTIVVDRETGKPLSQYFEEPNGVHLAAPPVEQRTSPKTAAAP